MLVIIIIGGNILNRIYINSSSEMGITNIYLNGLIRLYNIKDYMYKLYFVPCIFLFFEEGYVTEMYFE